LQTANKQELLEKLGESLETGNQYLPRLIQGIEEVAGLFRQGREAEGNVLLADALEGLEWLLAIIGTIAHIPNIANTVADINGRLEEFRSVMKSFAEAYSNQDTVLLGDVIEYEILPSLKFWQQSFAVLEKTIQSDAASN